MPNQRIQLDDLKADAASGLTDEDVARITGGSTHSGGVIASFGDGSVRSVTPSASETKPICYLQYKLER